MATQAQHDIGGTASLLGGGPVTDHDFAPSRLPIVGRGPGATPAASVVLRGEGEAFVVTLADAAGADLLSLGTHPEAEVIAAWRGLGAAAGLPLVVVGPDGTRETAYAQIGRLRFGGALPRRRRALPGGRRPRFLVRRKTGRLPLRPQVHREPEIIGGAA